MQSTQYWCQILFKLEFSRKIFTKKKHSNIKFNEYSSNGCRVVPCGRTDLMKLLVGDQHDTILLYRVIHKSLRDFRTRLRNNQDRHGRNEHINR